MKLNIFEKMLLINPRSGSHTIDDLVFDEVMGSLGGHLFGIAYEKVTFFPELHILYLDMKWQVEYAANIFSK